jgi:hypothetical protein
MRAVGRSGEHLRPAGAVDFDRVVAFAAFVEIGVVAGVPDHPVVAAFAEDRVGGVTAGERVIVGAPEQEVGAATTEERVVAGLTEK